jgi:3-deoxy-D-manno-octulosonate 8-phosphate phosphatase (KDO 8-P phosphatase)
MRSQSGTVREAAMATNLFGMDVDGVLTDGGIYYGEGAVELKRFNAQDGMGVTLLRMAGIVPFIITSRESCAVETRAAELGIDEVHQGVKDKMTCLESILERHGAGLDEVAYVGDDLSDLCIMLEVGLPIAVANARPEIKRIAQHVTDAGGGDGAVREAAEFVLRRAGVLEDLAARFRDGEAAARGL